jgi:hypothetical protein
MAVEPFADQARSRVMSLGTVVAIDTQQLLRAVCGVALLCSLPS